MWKNFLQLFKTKPHIGRSELVSLPEFGITEIEAKIDTGAYRGAIHCKKIEFMEHEGKKSVSFRLLDDSHPEYQEKDVIAHNYKTVQVTSSNGETEDRVVIETTIILGGQEITAELTLADREAMTYPLLIGRRSIKGFLIDPSVKNI